MVEVYGWSYDKYEKMLYFNADQKIELNEAYYDGGVPPLEFKIRASTQAGDYFK